MSQSLCLAFVALAFQTHMFAAESEAWGPVVDGVRLALAVSAGANPQLRIAAINVSDRPLLLSLGNLIGERFYDLNWRLMAIMPGGKQRRALDTSVPGAVGGRIDSLVVPLVPNCRYSVEVPLARFALADTGVRLEELRAQRIQLRVELDLSHAACPLYGNPNPNMIPWWRARTVSNLVQVPQ